MSDEPKNGSVRIPVAWIKAHGPSIIVALLGATGMTKWLQGDVAPTIAANTNVSAEAHYESRSAMEYIVKLLEYNADLQMRVAKLEARP